MNRKRWWKSSSICDSVAQVSCVFLASPWLWTSFREKFSEGRAWLSKFSAPSVPLSNLRNSFSPQHLLLCLLTGFGFSFPPHFSWGGQGRSRAAQANPTSPGIPTGYPALTSCLLGSSLDVPIGGLFISSVPQVAGWRWPVGRWLKISSNPFRQAGPSWLSGEVFRGVLGNAFYSRKNMETIQLSNKAWMKN